MDYGTWCQIAWFFTIRIEQVVIGSHGTTILGACTYGKSVATLSASRRTMLSRVKAMISNAIATNGKSVAIDHIEKASHVYDTCILPLVIYWSHATVESTHCKSQKWEPPELIVLGLEEWSECVANPYNCTLNRLVERKAALSYNKTIKMLKKRWRCLSVHLNSKPPTRSMWL